MILRTGRRADKADNEATPPLVGKTALLCFAGQWMSLTWCSSDDQTVCA